MSKLNGKAKEVLDACLSAESPEVRAKVYELVDVSGLEPDDPMFLILALTGQMRVLLEAAPADLSKLLNDWQSQSNRSLESIQRAIAQVEVTQQQQAGRIRQTLEIVTNDCVEDIKEVGMAATGAIAEANSETLAQARLAIQRVEELKNEVMTLRTSVEADRQTNINVLEVVLGRLGKSTKGLETAISQINGANTAITRLQQNTTWIKFTEWFSPLAALVIVLAIGAGGSWWAMSLKYNDSLNVIGRDLVNWNADRIFKCREDNNPKCTIWVVPPEQRK
ncbi:MAG: hypothetical protein KME05_10255 [Gloeocapsa sp. UFS-A4-WI-NPMV-4B04]|jgi:hypothetical protein|nr:hypothetical protein [Gloeocapsa sp. UFS-A4-WI-NPMV-4B04]